MEQIHFVYSSNMDKVFYEFRLMDQLLQLLKLELFFKSTLFFYNFYNSRNIYIFYNINCIFFCLID